MYQIGQVEKITGLSRRQIGYWDDSGLVEAAVKPKGPQRNRLWDFPGLVALRTVRRLRERNVSIQKIRTVLQYAKGTWAGVENHLSQLTFYVLGNGKEVLVLGPNEQFPVSALRAQGQTILVLPGEDIVREVHENIHQLADSPLSPMEAEESTKAWADYTSGEDLGETLDEIRRDLLRERQRA